MADRASVERSLYVALAAATAFVAVAPCRSTPVAPIVGVMALGLAIISRSPQLVVGVALASAAAYLRASSCPGARPDAFTVSASDWMRSAPNDKVAPAAAREHVHSAFTHVGRAGVDEEALRAFTTPDHLAAAQTNAVPSE